MATVAVVVPCHNYGAFLEECLASIEGQTRPADEIVVIDDGSDDHSFEIATGVAERTPALTVISRIPARGAVATFNDGTRATTADLVVIVSADDRISPKYLELMEAALSDVRIGFAYADDYLFGAEQGYRRAPEFARDQLAVENSFNGSGMFRRSLFDAIGGFDQSLERWGLEDWAFWVAMVDRGGVGTRVDGCWLDYRRHAGGSRNRRGRMRMLVAHLIVWRRHPRVVGVSGLMRWIGRSLHRNGKRLSRR